MKWKYQDKKFHHCYNNNDEKHKNDFKCFGKVFENTRKLICVLWNVASRNKTGLFGSNHAYDACHHLMY